MMWILYKQSEKCIPLLIKMANMFNVSIDYLLGRDKPDLPGKEVV